MPVNFQVSLGLSIGLAGCEIRFQMPTPSKWKIIEDSMRARSHSPNGNLWSAGWHQNTRAFICIKVDDPSQQAFFKVRVQYDTFPSFLRVIYANHLIIP